MGISLEVINPCGYILGLGDQIVNKCPLANRCEGIADVCIAKVAWWVLRDLTNDVDQGVIDEGLLGVLDRGTRVILADKSVTQITDIQLAIARVKEEVEKNLLMLCSPSGKIV